MTPAQIFILLELVTKYGPGIIQSVKTILSKKDVTVDDVEAIFKDLKPYDAFGIPSLVPAPKTEA